ncbi:unnamed protein product [Bursaphelenchus xylophilus]|uniref:Hexosyltransferase n=1 Tax=Bursaphelenchus xylophilus TaxID=6326 RepID=A0A1I7S624_BURXY|nr:unnamed protein product [Bursaphelenchus xylophilus]CAG9082356.1 unnamed protein product [Bursaphelenchus xylophilus]
MSKPTNSNVCQGVDAVVYVMTMMTKGATERRKALRNVVFNKTNLPSNYTVLHRYVVGRYPVEREYQKRIIEEITEFDDIIMYNIEENYRKNYIKWHTMHAWHMRHCPQVKYFTKMDDDVIIYLKRLFQWVDIRFGEITKGNNKYIVCKVMSAADVLRDSNHKSFLSFEQFNEPTYPEYCDGPVVFTTNETIADLVQAYGNMTYLSIDDVYYTGVVRQKAEIEMVNFEGFDGRGRRCSALKLPYFTSRHGKETVEKMIRTLETMKKVKC